MHPVDPLSRTGAGSDAKNFMLQLRICLHRNLPAVGEFQCVGQMLGTILHWRSGGPALRGSSAGDAWLWSCWFKLCTLKTIGSACSKDQCVLVPEASNVES